MRFVVTGAGGGHDIDLRRFAADGMTLLGRLRGTADGKLLIETDLEDTLARGEAWFALFKSRMDEYALKNAMAMPEEDPEEPVLTLPPWSRSVGELDLRGCDITSAIWCTGYRTDFAWIKLPVLMAPVSHFTIVA